MSNGLRIIGVKILQGCPPRIRKTLHEGELYLLYNDYEEDKSNPYNLKKSKDIPKVAEELYNVKDAQGNDIKVNISAIVGKNGDGKSSLVEVVLRILNNFAYIVGSEGMKQNLRCVENLQAILYYEINNDLYALSSEGEYSTLRMWKNGKQIDYSFDNLFYTTVINYSIYAYNSRLYEGEDNNDVDPGSWIDSLFHKNDEHQIPVVLNPMRQDGNIDINNEEYLAKQRLLTLFTIALPDDEIRKINDHLKAIGYKFTLEKEPKLIKKSIREYYHNTKNILYPLGTFEQMYQSAKDIMDRKAQQSAQPSIENESMLGYLTSFCRDFRMLFLTHKHFFEVATKAIEKEEVERATDLSTLAAYLRDFISWGYSSINNEDVQFFINLFLNTECKKYNYAFLYRLIVILKIWDTMEIEESELFNNDIDTAITDPANPQYAAQLYCCYKVISILDTYKPFTEHSHIYDSSINLLINSFTNNIELRELKNDAKEVLSLNDYRSLKLTQTLNYLRYISKFPQYEYYGADVEQDFVRHELKDDEDVANDYDKVNQYYISFDDLNKEIVKFNGKITSREAIKFLPPPIFDGGIVIENDEGETFDFMSLSSGMLQKLNTVGALMYHLRNLNDIIQGNIQYKNINVIFEEVELYFHPEYQREFVNYVLEMIHRSSLGNIDSINICFVTHSPFILSDMLRNNTLYLNNGYSVNFDDETFGANLYDLMVNSFFLKDNAMGQFASKKIENIISRYNVEETSISNEEKMLVGDIFIRNYLNGSQVQ